MREESKSQSDVHGVVQAFVVQAGKSYQESPPRHATGQVVSCSLLSVYSNVLKVLINSFFKSHRLHVPDPTDLLREGFPLLP